MSFTSQKQFHSHGGNIEEEARKLNLDNKKIIDASASIIPFKLPSKLRKSLLRTIKDSSIKAYPDRSYHSIKSAISNWHNIEPSMILPGNGASELFTWVARDAGLNGLSSLPSPCFGDYERALKCWGAPYIYTNLPLSWSNTKPQHFPIIPKTNVIWITNPHNPTGQLWSRSSIKNLLSIYKLVICDEAFISLVPEGEKQSVIDLTDKYKNLIVVRSLTKLLGLAGVRMGYVVTASERLSKWETLRDPWPINAFAINATNIIMQDKKMHNKWIQKTHKWIQKEGAWLDNNLSSFSSFKPLPTSTNFQLIKSNSSLIPLLKALKFKGILLRDCRSFIHLGENWLRISLQKRKHNIQIINSIKELIH